MKSMLLPLVGAAASVLVAITLVFLPGVSQGAEQMSWIGFESGSLSRFDSIDTSSGLVELTNERVYSGDYSARASYDGGGARGQAAVGVNVSWGLGDDVWYSAAIYLPVGFKQNQETQTDLIRWDNWPTFQDLGDYGGIVINAGDHRARLVKGTFLGSQDNVAGPFDVPEGRWFNLEVHQRFGLLDALNEVYMDGQRVASSTAPNSYGRSAERVLYGLAGIRQSKPAELWLDRVVTGLRWSDLTSCPWNYISPALVVAKRIQTNDLSDAWPGACWRPYADASPFNQELPPSPILDPDSSAIVNRLVSDYSGAGPQDLDVGGDVTDWRSPLYYASSSDPLFTIHCLKPWGTCEPEGDQIPIPDLAQKASGSDGHMAVVEPNGDEYDFWQVQDKPAGGGELDVSWGGITRIDGDGLGSDANAAHFGLAAGAIRAQELEAGDIDHALVMAVQCTDGTSVWPAEGLGRPCTELGRSNTDAPAMGMRFQLDYSDAEVDSLSVPDWKKTILKAMAHYGFYVVDTGTGSWAIAAESGATYSSFGVEDPLVTFASEHGLPSHDGTYVYNIRDGVDWSRLRVVAPCVARATC
jgi:hypothetical protein